MNSGRSSFYSAHPKLIIAKEMPFENKLTGLVSEMSQFVSAIYAKDCKFYEFQKGTDFADFEGRITMRILVSIINNNNGLCFIAIFTSQDTL